MERTVVIELGDTLIRVGMGGEVHPRLICQGCDYSLHLHYVNDTTNDNNANTLRERLQYMLTVFFSHHLPCKARDCRVLIVEKLLCKKVLRDCLVSTLLLDFQVTSISLQPDLLMPILTTGKSSGIIIDIGINECTVIAVAYGYIILQSLKIAAVGIDNCIKKFKKSIEMTIGHDVDFCASKDLFEKVAFCTVSSDMSSNDIYVAPRGGLSKTGFTISTRQSCFNHIVSGLIEDENDNDEFGGVAGSLLECLKSCPSDVRSVVSSNIIFCGEGSDIPGLPAAICLEATMKAKNDSKYDKIKDIFNSLTDQKFTIEACDYNRTNLAWIGGSLFSSLKSNDSKFIKLKDFANSNITDDDGSGNAINPERYLNAPDWMSLTNKDWIFLGPKLHPSQSARG